MSVRARTPRPPVEATLPGGGVYLEPRAFVTRLAPRSTVEIWETENLFRSDYAKNADHMVAAFDRKKNLFVGVVDLRTHLDVRDPQSPFAGCQKDLAVVARKAKVSPVSVLQVSGASIDPLYRNLGLGVALYIAAAALAKKHGMAIAADACFQSNTSEMALRVWRSRRFSELCVVSHLVAAYKG